MNGDLLAKRYSSRFQNKGDAQFEIISIIFCLQSLCVPTWTIYHIDQQMLQAFFPESIQFYWKTNKTKFFCLHTFTKITRYKEDIHLLRERHRWLSSQVLVVTDCMVSG